MNTTMTPLLQDAPTAQPARPRRVLLVVDDACTAPTVCASLRSVTTDEPLDALVVAPAHGGVDAQWYVDEDAARADATHRLRGCVRCLSDDGIHAAGRLGDADPVRAIADALQVFDADEILLVTAPLQPSRWLRPSVVDRARRTFDRPVRHIVMPAPSAR